MRQLGTPLEFLDILYSFLAGLVIVELHCQLVISLVVVAEVECLSSWYILFAWAIQLSVIIRINSKCAHIKFL